MSTTLAIAERELRSIFASTIAWILMAAFMAITGILFTAILLNANVASMQYLFSNISVVFSEAMDAVTIDEASFTVVNGRIRVLGTVSYDPDTTTATFFPDAPLDEGVTYRATVTADATDEGGTGLASDEQWNFTAFALPRVLITSPLDGARNHPRRLLGAAPDRAP